jgi:hypothetical protein
VVIGRPTESESPKSSSQSNEPIRKEDTGDSKSRLLKKRLRRDSDDDEEDSKYNQLLKMILYSTSKR